MDLLVYYWGRTPISFLHIPSDNTSTHKYTEQVIAPEKESWYTNAATLGDLNGDGHQDLIIGNYFPNNAEILNFQGTGVESMPHSMTRAANGSKNRLFGPERLLHKRSQPRKLQFDLLEGKKTLNTTNFIGKFLGLKLLLPPGRPAIVASATIHLPDGRKLVAPEVDGGNGDSSVPSSALHFGLGELQCDTQLRVDLQ